MTLIRKCLREAHDTKKKYADAKRIPQEYKVGDRVFLRVRPHKIPIRFRKGSKLAPWFVGPFKILERRGPIAYHLVLSPSLSCIHDVFHVSILRGYIYDESHIIDCNSLQVESDGHLVLEPVHIIARWILPIRG